MPRGTGPKRSLEDIRREVEKLEAVATGFHLQSLDESLAPLIKELFELGDEGRTLAKEILERNRSRTLLKSEANSPSSLALFLHDKELPDS